MDGATEATLKVLFGQIEGSSFDALLSPESSLRRVIKLLDASDPVKRLVRLLRGDHAASEAVLSRMTKIAATLVDFRFRNRHDVALAAYLYAIAVTSPKQLLSACRIVLTTPNTWLANQLVGLITSQWASQNSIQSQRFVLAANRIEVASSLAGYGSSAAAIQISPVMSGHVVAPYCTGLPENVMNVTTSDVTHQHDAGDVHVNMSPDQVVGTMMTNPTSVFAGVK